MTETAFLIALVIGLVQVIKKAKIIEKRYIPILALGLGIGLSFIASMCGYYGQDLLTGLLVGLSAVGFYSSQKTIRSK